MTPADSASFRLTLRGTTGPPTTFLLAAGRHGIGADAENAIRLDERGVSRFHAVLTCSHQGCELEDLGSKNGSSVNGQPIQRATVTHGDTLGIAAVRLGFEVLPRGDAEMALEWTALPDARPTTLIATATTGAGLEPTLQALFKCLRGLEERVRRRSSEPDWQGGLEAVVRHLGLAGAALFEWPHDDQISLLASVGRPPSWPQAADLAKSPTLDGHDRLRVMPRADGGLAVALRENGKSGQILVIPGLEGSTVSPYLLATCLLGFGAWDEVAADTTLLPPASKLKLPPEIAPSASSAMAEVYRQVGLVAQGHVPILILGETGVGKEHVARAIHEASPRAHQPFVAVNCAAIPAELLEAEMFGIGTGVATGVRARKGRFLEADRGTLFLDEIGDLPISLQAKLLRVLQEGEIQPLGEKSQKVDVRILAASHVDLAAAISEKRFREDLFYRLAGYVLRVPPLRERPEDLPILLGRFLQTMAREAGRSLRGVTVKALEELQKESWPGNVRQLQQVARRLVLLCPRGGAVDSRLVAEALAVLPTTRPAEKDPERTFKLGEQGLDDFLGTLEKEILEQALQATEGNRTRAAALLRISRNGLTRRMERLGFDTAAGDDPPSGDPG